MDNDEFEFDDSNNSFSNSKSLKNESINTKNNHSEKSIKVDKTDLKNKSTDVENEFEILNNEEMDLLNQSYVGKDLKQMIIYHKMLYDTIKKVNLKLTNLIKEKSDNYINKLNKPLKFEEKPIEDQLTVYNKEIELNDKYIQNYHTELNNINESLDKYEKYNYNSNLLNKIEKYKNKIIKIENEIQILKSETSRKNEIKDKNKVNNNIKFILKKIEFEIAFKNKIQKEIKKLELTKINKEKYYNKIQLEKNKKKEIIKEWGWDFNYKLIIKYEDLQKEIMKISNYIKTLNKYYKGKEVNHNNEIKTINFHNLNLKSKITKNNSIINLLNNKLESNKYFKVKMNTNRQKSYSLNKNIPLKLKSRNFIIKNVKPKI